MEQDAERSAGVRQSSTDDKRAERFEASARTAEALADTVEKSADVHEEMAATDPGRGSTPLVIASWPRRNDEPRRHIAAAGCRPMTSAA
jgi:hypothetical protein